MRRGGAIMAIAAAVSLAVVSSAPAKPPITPPSHAGGKTAAGSTAASPNAPAAGAITPAPGSTGKIAAGATPATAQTRGLVLAGLIRNVKGPCGNLYQLNVRGRKAMCSHGPDTAPAGVDVTVARDVTQLGTSSTTTAAVPCIGDGVSGPRVQAIYAVASDLPDRYSTVAPEIQGWAGEMDSAVNQSAAETGGGRHIRFVTNSDCSLNVAHVVLSPTGDDSFSNTINELQSLGYNLSNRKYLIWADASVYCGISVVSTDDTAGSANASNTTNGYARVDSGCWGRTDHLSELHELMHTLGAVQLSAPHSTGNFHCTDEYDAMCYQDSSTATMTYPCPSSHEWLLDCGHDDYFSTAPTTGSYLATHWNTADSVFLSSASSSGGTGTAALSLTRTASPTSYNAVGQTISYGYTVTNSGTTTLGPDQFTVSDSRIKAGTPFACGIAATTLPPGAMVACSASSAVTQADLDAGSVSSSATASGGGVTSPAVSVTVTATQTKGLSLTRTVSPTSYSAAGQTISFGYTLSNTGNVTLGPAQFTVTDTKVNAGSSFACGSTSTVLAPGATLSCSASYLTTQADVTTGSVSSTATAAGAGVTSAAVSVTVTYTAPPAPTSTTTTTTLTGSVSSKHPTAKFSVSIGAGATVDALKFSATGKTKSTATLSLSVLDGSGSVVAGTSGPSVVRLTTSSLSAGTYTWQVSGSTSASFSLQITYTSP